MTKRLEGRDEPILDPDIPIIDAHHHLFDRPALRYMPEEYLEDLRTGHKVIATVWVEGNVFFRPEGPDVLRPLGEIEFANGVGAMFASGHYGEIRMCAGLVGYADLRRGSDIGWLLDRAMAAAPDRFRGIRQIVMDHPSDAPFRASFSGKPPSGLYQHPNFGAGLKEIAARNLVYDATGFHLQLPDIIRHANANPSMPFVLNHMTVAMGLEMDDAGRHDVFLDWRARLAEAAQCPNIYCKVGGLGMPMWGFGIDQRQEPTGYRALADIWRPYVETAIELFGAHRCMMESNFPPDSRSCGYVPLWNALKWIVRDASGDEKADLFHRTAARVYRLDLGSLLPA